MLICSLLDLAKYTFGSQRPRPIPLPPEDAKGTGATTISNPPLPFPSPYLAILSTRGVTDPQVPQRPSHGTHRSARKPDVLISSLAPHGGTLV